MGLVAAFHGGAALGHGGVADDQGGLAGFELGVLDGGADFVVVVAVHLDDLPAQSFEDLLVVSAVRLAGGPGQLDFV